VGQETWTGLGAISWHVRYVEIGSEPVALLVVDLRVDEDPSLPGGVPVLADPVVFELPGGEVAAEAAACAGRRAVGAEHGGHQDGEVPAVDGKPGRGRPGDVQWPAVAGQNLCQYLLDGTDVRAGPVFLGQRHPVAVRHVLMDKQAVGDRGQVEVLSPASSPRASPRHRARDPQPLRHEYRGGTATMIGR
jgi:hypothetical protein